MHSVSSISGFNFFSSVYPSLCFSFIVVGCVYLGLLFLQSEQELHWPRWHLDAIDLHLNRTNYYLHLLIGYEFVCHLEV